MLTINVSGLDEWRDKMDDKRFMRAVTTGMDRAAEFSVGYIQAKKLSEKGPETLGIVSQRLRGSVTHTKPVAVGKSVRTLIGTRVKYGAVHEYGRSTQYPITPKNGKALSFKIGNKTITVKSVTHPPIKPRRWLSKGLGESAHFFTEEIQDEILEELNQ